MFSLAISSETLEKRPALLYIDTQSIVSFSVISKCLTLNGYFALNYVFAPVWLSPTVRHLKNNCVETNKDRHTMSYFQRRKSLAGTLVSGNMRFVSK